MKTLLILHGWQSNKKTWQRVKREIEEAGIKVLVPDLPGFGKQAKLSRPWNLDDYVEWVKKYIEENGSFPLYVLGHSFGGRIAIKLSVKYPPLIKGLILVAPGGLKNFLSQTGKKEKLIKKITPFFKKFSFLPGYSFLRTLFYYLIVGKTDYLYVKGNLKQTFKNIIAEDLTPLLTNILHPTLIIWGRKDEVLPFQTGITAQEKIKNAVLEIMENVGHSPQKEDPQHLAEKILGFIIDTEYGSSS